MAMWFGLCTSELVYFNRMRDGWIVMCMYGRTVLQGSCLWSRCARERPTTWPGGHRLWRKRGNNSCRMWESQAHLSS